MTLSYLLEAAKESITCQPFHAPWYHVPVGVFAVLTGLAAAVMAIKEKASWRWKGAWLVAIFLFTAAELRMIIWSDADAAREKEYASCLVEKDFQGIEDQDQKQFEATTTSLGKSLETTNRLLTSAEETRKNTEKFARVEMGYFGSGIIDPTNCMFPSSAPFAIGKNSMNYSFQNQGNANANIERAYLGVYVDTPNNDPEAQQRVLKTFNEEWKAQPQEQSSILRVKDCAVIPKQYQLNSDDIAAFQSRTKGVYFLFRVQYRDTHGTWATDFCENIPSPLFRTGKSYQCDKIMLGDRYSVKPQ